MRPSQFQPSPFNGGNTVQDRLGLQLWSLRAQTKESTTGALDLVAQWGIKLVETAGTGSLSAADFKAELDARQLTAIAAHAGYEVCENRLEGVIADAKILGAQDLVMPWLKHNQAIGLTMEDAHRAAAHFNAWGEACRKAGMTFGWHPHGFEFAADANGETPFEFILRETNPEWVTLEMDVFWVRHAGLDPVALLGKHAGRWRLLHVKDMRKGAPTGFSTGSAPATDKVAVGSGQIDWPAVLRAAEKAGVRHYFIEDEGVQPLADIPAGVNYLKALNV
jgi:sugar phosphate isomerase/epimerase